MIAGAASSRPVPGTLPAQMIINFQKQGGNKMEEKKNSEKTFSTCLEGFPCAEMMQKMMGQQGIGSLCQDMMKSMMKGFSGSKGENKATKEEESHGSKE
jgi:hypothetical protein